MLHFSNSFEDVKNKIKMQTIILKVLYLDFHFVLILDFSEVA